MIDPFKSFRQGRGYTLVELMVGLFLSVFIVMMTVAYLVTSAKTFSVQTNEALIQENARFALDKISRIIREAGSDPSNSMLRELPPVFAQSHCSDNANRSNVATDLNDCTLDELSIGSDRLGIAKVIREGTKACDGSDILVATGQTVRVATVLWAADLDLDGIHSLYCQSYDIDAGIFVGRASPLVEGVDLIQFQFGVDLDIDGAIDQYQNQSLRKTQTSSAEQKPRLKAIRFAMLINPGSGIRRDQVVEDLSARTYQLLDGNAVTFNDELPRSVYSSTVMLPSVN